MVGRSHQASCGPSPRTPQHENDAAGAGIERGDDGIGESLPSATRMAACFACAHGEHAVEKEDALASPAREIAMFPSFDADVVAELSQDVAQRWRRWSPCGNREGKTMSLTRAVIGVLSEDDDLDGCAGNRVECREDLMLGRVHGALCALRGDEVNEVNEGGERRLARNEVAPLCVHRHSV